MPEYSYICVDCGEHFSIQHHMSEPMPLVVCPKCQSEEVQRDWKAIPVHFKGHGFYTTDYPQPGQFDE